MKLYVEITYVTTTDGARCRSLTPAAPGAIERPSVALVCKSGKSWCIESSHHGVPLHDRDRCHGTMARAIGHARELFKAVGRE